MVVQSRSIRALTSIRLSRRRSPRDLRCIAYRGGTDHVLVRHEQAAVHIANGLCACDREVGVVPVTSGPGPTNAITGIATAYMDSISISSFPGRQPLLVEVTMPFKGVRHGGISRPVVKHSFLVKQTKTFRRC
ncbi:thiamine pyrophosphate-binding protein [Escherichia coli]